MSTHHLIVTLDDLTEDEQAEYDAYETDEERAEIDGDRRRYDVECSGVDQTCHGWEECMEKHDFTDEMEDDGEGTAHGVYHQHMWFGWAVETGSCALVHFRDAWVDSGYDLARELGPGRHPIDFDWDDEYCILLAAGPAPVPS